MNISDKLKEIKKQPEHVRLRWAWGLAAAITFFVAVIWLVSLNFQKQKKSDFRLTGQQKNFINEFQDQAESLKDATDQLKNISKESSD